MVFKYQINRTGIQKIHYLLKTQVWGTEYFLVETNNKQTIFLIHSSISKVSVSRAKQCSA